MSRWKKISTVFSEKLKARNLQVEKKNVRLDSKGIYGLLLRSLITFKVTGSVLLGFFVVIINPVIVTLRVRVGLIGEELIGPFGVDRLGRSLSLGVNGNVRKIQVREGGFDLIVVVIKTISKGAPKLLQ